MRRIRFVLFIFALTACSSAPSTNPQVTAQSGRDYKTVLEAWTRKEQAYANFSAAFQVTAILLSRDLVEEQIQFDAKRFNWSSEETQGARQKALYELQTQTTFLVSLYTDRDEDNNLDKASPAWNLY